MRSLTLTFIVSTALAYLALTADKGNWLFFAASLWVTIRHFILTEEGHYESNTPSIQDSENAA